MASELPLPRPPGLIIRYASGLSLLHRVKLQVERDELLARLGRIDDQLLELSQARRSIVAELAGLRETLYPPIPWCHGRRPPDLDAGPLPPVPDESERLHGRWLRATSIAILRRHGPTALRELHALLHRYGYVIGARRPVAALSDAMGHEVEAGRARRVARGVYEAVDLWPPPRRRKPPTQLRQDQPDPWIERAPSKLDRVLDEDPASWTVPVHDWTASPTGPAAAPAIPS